MWVYVSSQGPGSQATRMTRTILLHRVFGEITLAFSLIPLRTFKTSDRSVKIFCTFVKTLMSIRSSVLRWLHLIATMRTTGQCVNLRKVHEWDARVFLSSLRSSMKEIIPVV